MHPPSSLDIFIKRRLISEKIRKNRCVIHNGLASASMNWRFLCLLAVIQWLSSTKPFPSENVVISVFLSPVSAVASVYQLEEINSKMVHLASWWTPHPSFSLRCFLFQFQPFLGELHLIALGVIYLLSFGNLMIIPQQSDNHHKTILWASIMRPSFIFICSSAIAWRKTQTERPFYHVLSGVASGCCLCVAGLWHCTWGGRQLVPGHAGQAPIYCYFCFYFYFCFNFYFLMFHLRFLQHIDAPEASL